MTFDPNAALTRIVQHHITPLIDTVAFLSPAIRRLPERVAADHSGDLRILTERLTLAATGSTSVWPARKPIVIVEMRPLSCEMPTMSRPSTTSSVLPCQPVMPPFCAYRGYSEKLPVRTSS